MARQKEHKYRRGLPWQVIELHYRSRADFNAFYSDY